jgi:hypothetical protein
VDYLEELEKGGRDGRGGKRVKIEAFIMKISRYNV